MLQRSLKQGAFERLSHGPQRCISRVPVSALCPRLSRKKGKTQAWITTKRKGGRSRPEFIAGEPSRRCALDHFGLLRRAAILATRIDIAVNEFDHSHRGVVAVAEARLEHTRVTARTLLVARPEHLKQLLHHCIVAQGRHGQTTCMQVAALAERNQLLNDGAQVLCLRQRRNDLLVLDQRGGHVGEHRLAVLGGAVEAPTPESMTHWLSPFYGRRAKERPSLLCLPLPLAGEVKLSSALRSAGRDPQCSPAASPAHPCRDASPWRPRLP